MMAVQSVIGVVFAVVHLGYWWWMMTRGQERWRRRCERKYGVTITHQGKGFWKVNGDKTWLRRVGIELLQLGFIMGVFVVWAVAMLGVIALMNLFD